VHEVISSDHQDQQQQQQRRFTVVVHVHSDHAFRKYLDHCSHSDLLLYRGLLLTVSTSSWKQTTNGPQPANRMIASGVTIF
jgi:hypothetical protein